MPINLIKSISGCAQIGILTADFQKWSDVKFMCDVYGENIVSSFNVDKVSE